MDAPVLFYYEDQDSGGKPKGTISLANIKCRVPKSKRKDFEHAFRVDVMGAAEGHNKFIWAPETEEEIIRAPPVPPPPPPPPPLPQLQSQTRFHFTSCRLAVAAWMEVMEGQSRNENALGKQLRDRRRGSVMVAGSGMSPGMMLPGMSPSRAGGGGLGGFGGMDAIGE
jgi:hypothetical protein